MFFPTSETFFFKSDIDQLKELLFPHPLIVPGKSLPPLARARTLKKSVYNFLTQIEISKVIQKM